MDVLAYKSSLLPLLVLVVAVILLGFPLADRRGELYEMRRRRAEARLMLRRLRAERSRLLSERKALLTRPSAIERVAREQYGLVAPGEYPVEIKMGIEKDAPSPSVTVPSDGWDWLLGRGGYPWRLPLVVLCVGAILFALLELLRQSGSTRSIPGGGNGFSSDNM